MKEWIFDGSQIGLYQDLTNDENTEASINGVKLCIHDQSGVHFECQSNIDNVSSQLSLSVSVSELDKLSTVWCEKRHINVNKYTLGELLEKCDDASDDNELKKLILERESQEELEYDNIFEVVASDSSLANVMKERCDEFIKVREAGRALSKLATYVSTINSEEEHIAALALLEIMLEDYDSNLLLIDALSASISRYEQSVHI